MIKTGLKRKGMSLLEMLAVVVVVVFLGGLVALNFLGREDAPRETRAARDIESISQAVTLYYRNTGSMPAALEDLVAAPQGVSGWSGPYLSKQSFNDPWRHRYQLKAPGKLARPYEIWSFGADGEDGTEDDITLPKRGTGPVVRPEQPNA